jgi:hypothetical protein
VNSESSAVVAAPAPGPARQAAGVKPMALPRSLTGRPREVRAGSSASVATAVESASTLAAPAAGTPRVRTGPWKTDASAGTRSAAK